MSAQAMGSVVEIYVAGPDKSEIEQSARDALLRVEWIEQQISHFLPESDISIINVNAFERDVTVSPGLFALLERLRELTCVTDDAFDVTRGKLVRAWGFFRRGVIDGQDIEPPDDDTLQRLVVGSGWSNVELDANDETIRFLTPEVELHLGAVGKGYAVQCAADYLVECGVDNALLNFGYSSIVGIGAGPERDGWPIGLNDGAETFHVRDRSVTTSSATSQTVTASGKRVSHLFDPLTGRPVETSGSFTVIANDAVLGEALSTACCVRGVDWAESCAQSRPDVEIRYAPPQPAE